MAVARSSSGGVVIHYTDDVTFARKLLDVDVAAQLKRSLGLGYKLCSVTSCRPADAWVYFSGA